MSSENLPARAPPTAASSPDRDADADARARAASVSKHGGLLLRHSSSAVTHSDGEAGGYGGRTGPEARVHGGSLQDSTQNRFNIWQQLCV
ncbi:unnamed protein product [Merluccius merluccius]